MNDDITSMNARPDAVRYGDWVEIEYITPAAGPRRVHLVPPPNKATLKDGDVSTSSPLGSALFGKKIGDTFTINAPQGTRTIAVKHIERKK